MAKSKYDLIIELLEYKKLTPIQRERILKLSLHEIKNENIREEELIKRIEEIEQLVNPNRLIKKDNPILGKPAKALINYTDPSKLFAFLKDYNTDPILKTTCHQIDSNELSNILDFCDTEEYDFKKHRQKVQERFLELINDDEKYTVHYKLKNLMYVYITGETYLGKKASWTDERIAINWNTNSIENWCNHNKNKIPHPDSGLYYNQGEVEYEIKPSINTNIFGQKKLRSFSDLILHFKYLFHLRSDNSLLKIINKINTESANWNNKIDFIIDGSHFPENLEFFTNVERLVQAYKIIINLILDVVDKNKLLIPIVKLSLYELKDGMVFSIHHQNSVFKKTIQNIIEKDGQAISGLIKQQINGMCDFYLKADFGNKQYVEINIWDGQPRDCRSIDFMEGVEYILKFRK